MIMRRVSVLGLLCAVFFIGSSAAQCRHREAAVGRFLSGLTGAAIANDAFGNQCYYQDGPAYDFIYPGAPIYAYDYPTYVYSPIYAYADMKHEIYPSYYFSR